jgi:hypothetical protein
MNASATIPPPDGQNHDREDAVMEDPDGLTNGHLENTTGNSELPRADVAVEVAAVDEDAMDTALDNAQGLVLPNGSADSQEPAGNSPSSPAPNGVTQDTPNVDAPQQQAPTATDNSGDDIQPPMDPGTQPPVTEEPPPPPPVDPVRSDSDSSDDDDGTAWHPIQEDTSLPDEAELKEIEEAGQASALDHAFWEGKTFTPLDEPEYCAGETGRIDWLVERYNGTKEDPNKEIVMKSPPVNIGGYEWQIKFYPKGNDSDYLSVYVECLSVGDAKVKPGQPGDERGPTQDAEMPVHEDAMHTDAPISPSREIQHAPLPLLDDITVPKRKSVAAQVSVVVYNPAEPRVNFMRTCLHRFCSGSPDWGWTRFHGPYYDIPRRHRGQRQALLRNDKLAFTSYVRIVSDETNCLWEHHSRDNPWDSFAMTGLQSLSLGEGASPPGGNLISAIASWMLFKPFRKFLYEFKVPHPDEEPFVRPKPLLAALQKILYMLRTQVKPGAGPVVLDDVLDAMEWYGIHDRIDDKDVIETWEILRFKIEEELADTPAPNFLDTMFGFKKDYSSGVPSYRAPVIGVGTMQEAVNKAPDLLRPSQPLPQLLTVELNRQDFDLPTRSYVKVLNKVALDDHINVRGTGYTLYGFVVHRQTLQSNLYHPVLRPEGPNSKWYSYADGKEENMVKCLPQRQAIDAHEGKVGSGKVTGNEAVAYVVMYVRDDVAEYALRHDPEDERWDVPSWLRSEVDKTLTHTLPPEVSSPPTVESIPDQAELSDTPKEIPAPELHEFQVVDSRAFLQHEGPGTFDAYDPKWLPGSSDLVYTVQLSASDSGKEVREKLAQVIKDVQDPRQVKFWFLDAMRGTVSRPSLLSTGNIEYSSGSTDRYADQGDTWTLRSIADNLMSYRIWVHVLDFASLPELPKEEPPVSESTQPLEISSSTAELPPSEEFAAPVPAPPPPNNSLPESEDTPMSEPDEPLPAPPVETEHPQPVPESADAAETPVVEMEVEVAIESAAVSDPPAVDVVIPNSAPTDTEPPADTEMGGTQDPLPPPPPPPADLQTEPPPPVDAQQEPPPPPPPAPVPSIPDEIYFFLKFFNTESQTLESRGSHIALKSARVDTTVHSLLGLPSEQKIDIYEEEDLTTTHAIRPRRSFAQNDLHNTAVLIASFPPTEEERSALAGRAAFADPQPYLAFRAKARNFPSKVSGHFTNDHFSSQYYKGEMKNGHRHGHGTRIYHSGDTYTGSFRLSQRHGHGLYTFQNGDTYDGEWVDNQQHGTGTFVEASTGNTYVGGWKHDKKFGEGVTHWKNAQETERLCRICWEEGAEAAFYDCGHVVACLGCARRVDSCPVCRKRVLSAMKLYYVA